MYGIKNPVQETMASLCGAPKFFEDYVLIPSYGNTIEGSNKKLKTYHDLAQLSMSFNSCDDWLKRFCFGAGFEIIERQTPGLIMPNTEPIQDTEFVDLFKRSKLSFNSLIRHTGTLNRQRMESGDFWLLCRLIRVGEEIRIVFECIDYRTCYKVLTSDFETPIAMHAKEFSRNFFQRIEKGDEEMKLFPISTIGEDFNWSGSLEEDDEIYTLIHGYIEMDKNSHYGSSPLDCVLNWMQSEWNYGNLTCKISSSETVTKNILAVEAEPEETGKEESEGFTFGDRASNFKRFSTNRGSIAEADTMLLMEYFENAPELLSLDLNRSKTYQEYALNESAGLIYSRLGVNQILANRLQPKGGIGSEQVKNLLTLSNVSTVIPLQNYFSNFWNEVLFESFTQLGVAEEKIKGIRFGSTINQLINQIGSINEATNAIEP